mgnify:CR=1 FL=1
MRVVAGCRGRGGGLRVLVGPQGGPHNHACRRVTRLSLRREEIRPVSARGGSGRDNEARVHEVAEMVSQRTHGETDFLRNLSCGPRSYRIEGLQNLTLPFTDSRMIGEQDESVAFAARPGGADYFEQPAIH